MKHRHLTHEDFTIAAIEDILARGQAPDWVPLITIIRADPYGEVADKTLMLCDLPLYAAPVFRRIIAQARGVAHDSERSPVYSDHTRLEERSLALHRLVAERLLANPALLDKARDNLRRWQKTAASSSLAEWEQILNGPVDQVAQFMVERSERATRLRQSSPFPGILTEAERKSIYDAYSEEAAP